MASIENFPKYIETVDDQCFRVDSVFTDFLIVVSDVNEVIYYNFKESKFYDGDKNLLDLKPKTPRLYQGDIKFRKLRNND